METDDEVEQTEFKFSELDQSAKEHALEQHARNMDDSGWAECVLEAYKTEHGPNNGFDIDTIHYSGFWSQGDGASWKGRINTVKFIDTHLTWEDPDYAKVMMLRELLNEDPVNDTLDVSIYNGHYVHSNMMNVSEIDMDFDGIMTTEETLREGPLAGANCKELYDAIGGAAFCRQVSEWMKDEAKAMADRIYRCLEEAYDYEVSEENFAELCDANEYLFDKNGDLI